MTDNMKWCKERALEYLDRSSKYYSPNEAFASMLSDMNKNEDTQKVLESQAISFLVMTTMTNLTHDSVKRFIEGFP